MKLKRRSSQRFSVENFWIDYFITVSEFFYNFNAHCQCIVHVAACLTAFCTVDVCMHMCIIVTEYKVMIRDYNNTIEESLIACTLRVIENKRVAKLLLSKNRL